MNGWLAGAATTAFEVPPGTRLGGYADRAQGSTGTHDALEISALSLESDGRWLHIVTADVVGVDSDLAAETAAAAGVDASDILLCATHTHSGPLGVAHRLHPASPLTVEPELRTRFVATAAEVVAETLRHVRPVALATGETRVEGAWTNRTDPGAAGSDRVSFLTVTGEDGVLDALMMLIPCHPTVLGAWNLEVSADLHGGIRRAIRARLEAASQDATLLTATSAAGDISTRFSRRESSFAEVDRLGELVVRPMVSALERPRPVEGGLMQATETVWLPMRERDAEAEARRHAEALAAWQMIEHDPAVSESEKRRVYTRLQGASILREMGDIAPVAVTIGGWLLGDVLAIVTVPGELFASCGRLIEEASPFDSTWVVGYANGYAGYLVDDAAIAAGTYEALASPYAPGAGQVVVDAALKMLRDLA